MKQGLSLITNLETGARPGLFSAIAAATTLPVAMMSTWPGEEGGDGGVVVLVALDGVVGGASLLISCSSMAPRVAPTVLPARSSGFSILASFRPNTPWKNGA